MTARVTTSIRSLPKIGLSGSQSFNGNVKAAHHKIRQVRFLHLLIARFFLALNGVNALTRPVAIDPGFLEILNRTPTSRMQRLYARKHMQYAYRNGRPANRYNPNNPRWDWVHPGRVQINPTNLIPLMVL